MHLRSRLLAALPDTALRRPCFAAPALATPVATDDGAYAGPRPGLPRPAGRLRSAGRPCSPNAQGNVPATQFIQFDEFLDALKYMNQKPEWQRYLEVWPLDGKLGDGAGQRARHRRRSRATTCGKLEFTPKREYQSAGLPTTDARRASKSDLIVVRVTDESVPDAGKKRYALSLSIHGIERAGVEGGTRAMEDLVTAAHDEARRDEPVVPEAVKAGAPTLRATCCKKTIIYFTYPNPDGWRRGSVTEGGVFFQRYNGNGVDLNRDWPDIGFSFRALQRPVRARERARSSRFYDDVQQSTGAQFAAGDDLHGQPFADALSYTLLPHGRHDFGKDLRIRETAKTIHRASERRCCGRRSSSRTTRRRAAARRACRRRARRRRARRSTARPGARSTTRSTTRRPARSATGSTRRSGLGADGIDNEMSFSHLDKNIVFDPHTEQLHVDGNKALIYAHLARDARRRRRATFDAPGAKGYVPNQRLKRERAGRPAGAAAGHERAGRRSTRPDRTRRPDGSIVFPFEVKRTSARHEPGSTTAACASTSRCRTSRASATRHRRR